MDISLKYSRYAILILLLISFCCNSCRNKNTEDLDSNETANHSTNYTKEDATRFFEESILINKAGNFHKGFKLLDKAVEIDPISHLGYRGWMKLRKLRDYENALKDFNHLDSLTPDFIDAPWGEDIDFLRGECYFGMREYRKSINYFLKGIDNHGKDWVDNQTFVYLGICYRALDDAEKAIESFNQAILNNKNTPEAYLYLAELQFELNNKQEAMKNLKNAKTTFNYKREDIYNEYLNEIYLSDINTLELLITTGAQ